MTSVNKEQDARELRPLTPIQRAQTREFIRELEHECQTYWDMVDVGDTLCRELHLTPELIILYSDGVEDFNPWYEAWRMNSWQIEGSHHLVAPLFHHYSFPTSYFLYSSITQSHLL